MNKSELLFLMMAAEKEAGALMLQAHDVMAECKSDARNVVTEYDRKIQDLLSESFSAAIPDAHFFCEESDRPDSLDAEYVFIIDPIDGTMNFVRGFQHSCVSVACMHKGEITAAAVYNPYLDEMFTAIKGEGAKLNGRKISVDDSGLNNSVCCVGTSPYYPELADRTFSLAKRLYIEGLDIRRGGSAELDLCSVAAGRAGLFFELKLSFWDYAAGYLIASEAGARVTDIDGNPLPFDGSFSSVLCAGENTIKDFLEK